MSNGEKTGGVLVGLTVVFILLALRFATGVGVRRAR